MGIHTMKLRPVKQAGFSLNFNERALVKVDLPDQLSVLEREKLQ